MINRLPPRQRMDQRIPVSRATSQRTSSQQLPIPPAPVTQTGAMTQTASASTATTGLAAGATFVFAANFGNVTLTNFDSETVVIEIDHTVFADFQALLAAASDDGSGNSVITADPYDTITIKNVTVAQLIQHQGDFHFTGRCPTPDVGRGAG